MDREKYDDEAMRQLNDRDVYIPLKKDPTPKMIKKINARINRLHGGYISDSTLRYLLINSDVRAGRFYLLPKTQTICPRQPVISGSNMPNEKISAFVDHQLKPLVPQISSYVKNTNDFL